MWPIILSLSWENFLKFEDRSIMFTRNMCNIADGRRLKFSHTDLSVFIVIEFKGRT
jgi:hypothetical protein